MVIKIDTNKIEDANEFGELLREYCFGSVYARNSTFDLKPEFRKMFKKDAKKFVKKILCSERWWRDWCFLSDNSEKDLMEETLEMQKEVYNTYLENCYTNNKGIKLAWYWDGGEELTIECDNKTVNNPDCNCDYCWAWL